MGNISVCLEEPLEELLNNYQKKYKEDTRRILLRLINARELDKKNYLTPCSFDVLINLFVNMSKTNLSDEFKKSWRKATFQKKYGSIEYEKCLLTFEYEEMGKIWTKTWKLSYDVLGKQTEANGYFYLKKTCRHKHKKRSVVYTLPWGSVSKPAPSSSQTAVKSKFNTFTLK